MIVWVSSALRPFWGFQVGWMKWLCGVIDNALYPVLFLDYLLKPVYYTRRRSVEPEGNTSKSFVLWCYIRRSFEFLTDFELNWCYIPLSCGKWTDGYLADFSGIIGGGWLRLWVRAAAATSNMGMFLVEMSSDSFQFLGMALSYRSFFAERSKYRTPLVGILLSALGVLLLYGLSFQGLDRGLSIRRLRRDSIRYLLELLVRF
ncbi:unnamed protein product [Cochlearia groenlandica]